MDAPNSEPLWDRSLQGLDFCVIDTETTGGRAHEHRVIEVAALHYRDGIIYDKFQTLINPGAEIPDWITILTGIDNTMVKAAPPFADVARPLRRVLDRGIFVAHNAQFDYSFVTAEFQRAGEIFESPFLCTVKLARLLYPELKSRSLGNLCEELLIDIYDRHRASGDAEATVYVLKNLLMKVEQEHGVKTWGELMLFLDRAGMEIPKAIPYTVFFHLPESPGYYEFLDGKGNILFKGSTKNIRRRIRTHFSKTNDSIRSQRLRDHAVKLDVNC